MSFFQHRYHVCGSNKIIPVRKEIPNQDRVPNRYKPSGILMTCKMSSQSTNQRNKLLEKGKIVHKVLELNLVVSIHVPHHF